MNEILNLKVGDFFTSEDFDKPMTLVTERIWLSVFDTGAILIYGDAGFGSYQVMQWINDYVQDNN
jgi:hypothetical protein